MVASKKKKKKEKPEQKKGIKASTRARTETTRLSLCALIPRSDAEHPAWQDKTDRPRIRISTAF